MIANQIRFRNQKHNEYPTPNWLFRTLDILEGAFDLDAAATAANTKCVDFFCKATDGLVMPWSKFGRNVYCNPPYSGGHLTEWITKAINESLHCKVVMLLPSYTDAPWFLELVLPYSKKIYFIEGRVKFEGTIQAAPFASIAVVFDSKIKKRQELIPLRCSKRGFNGRTINRA